MTSENSNSHTEDISSSFIVDSLYSSAESSSENEDSFNNNNNNNINNINNDNRIHTNLTNTPSLRVVPSNAPSMARTLTKTVTNIWNAVQDDNKQTAEEGKSGDLNKLLESRFDLGDAFQIEDNRNDGEAEQGLHQHDESDFSEKDHSPLPSDLEATPRSSQETSTISSFSASSLTNSAINTLNRRKVNGNNNNNPSNEDTLEKVFTNKSTGQLELPPDRGYAWVVVFSVFLVMFNTWGCNSAFGVFLSYYLNNGVYKGATKYDYAIIAGLTVFLGQGASPIGLLLMRIIGRKPTMLIGTIFLLAGFLLAAFSTRLWELYLTQGVLIGFSIAFIASPATTVLPGWFLKKRAVSIGISLLGTGAGGVTFGLASQKMISDNGDTRLCYVMLAVVNTVCVIVAIILVKSRPPIKSTGLHWDKIKIEAQRLFAWGVIKQPQVPLICIWFTLALLGYNLMIFTLASYAVARGMTSHQGSSLTAILNGAQVVGRPLMGLLGDRVGRANITIIMTTVITIYLFVFWITAHTYVQLIFFSIMVGSCIGVANVMNTVLIADLVKPSEFLAAWSFVNYAGSPALLCCELIAQALVKEQMKNPYLYTQIFAGCCFVCALIMIFILREYTVKIKLTSRQEENNLKLLQRSDNASDASSGVFNDNKSTAESWEIIEHRRDKYNLLLGAGVKKYFMRMLYPMKV
ncbi:hypothetical protein RI543_000894 [Arxiozyma heterogenica]|uniref:Major facilitator superfamily (MFS) profile domain-containing protein n=1 Tax=Arxiozyma heterogenica TaxID=278026 RepID=A0AAN7WTZ0_9SACH|nr:hypothetical protein RI543_000894 [Kazachstania heterogenica]